MDALLDELIWMDENAFSCLPLASSVAASQPTNFHLTGNGSSEGSAGNAQEFAGVDVSELHFEISVPTVAVADNFPMISRVAFSFFVSVGRYFLVVTQRAGEVVGMEVLLSSHVVQPDDFSALYLFTTIADFSSRPLDHPVGVHIVRCLYARDTLLARPSAILHIVRMQSASIVRVQELNDTTTRHITGFAS